jgi:non-specific serine/threonine protein kinase
LTAHHGVALARLTAEQDNLRAAVRWAVDQRDGDMALRLASALEHFWTTLGLLSEGRHWLETALAMTQPAQADGLDPESASAVRAQALAQAAFLARHQGDYEVARRRAEEALAVHRAQADTPAMVRCLGELAVIAGGQGDVTTARARHAEAIALQRERDDPVELGRLLNDGGWQAYLAGDDGRARTLLEESLAVFRAVGDTTVRLGYTLDNLGRVLLARGEYARAGALMREALHLAHHHRDTSLLWVALDGLAWLAAPVGLARGEPVAGAERAARLFGTAAALREARGEVLSPDEERVHARQVAIAQAHLDAATWQATWAQGRVLSLDAAVAYALEDGLVPEN